MGAQVANGSDVTVQARCDNGSWTGVSSVEILPQYGTWQQNGLLSAFPATQFNFTSLNCSASQLSSSSPVVFNRVYSAASNSSLLSLCTSAIPGIPGPDVSVSVQSNYAYCKGKTQRGNFRSSSIRIPDFVVQPQDVSLMDINSVAVLSCAVTPGSSAQSIQWYFQADNATSSAVLLNQSSTIVIESVIQGASVLGYTTSPSPCFLVCTCQQPEVFMFLCSADRLFASLLTTPLHTTATHHHNTSPAPLGFTMSLGNYETVVQQGSAVSLQCSVNSSDAQVQWLKDMQPVGGCQHQLGCSESCSSTSDLLPAQRHSAAPRANHTQQHHRHLIPDTNLLPFRNYSVAVTPFNSIGGGPTAFGNWTTLEAAPSAPPQNLITSVTEIKKITVSWNPPLAADQNGMIIGYMEPGTRSKWQLGLVLAPTTTTTTTITINITLPSNLVTFSHLWVIVMRLNDSLTQQINGGTFNPFTSNATFANYSLSVPAGSPYVAAELPGNRQSPLVYILGNESQQNDAPGVHPNKALMPGTTYTAFVWGFFSETNTVSSKREASANARQYVNFSSSGYLAPVKTASTTSAAGATAGQIAGGVIGAVLCNAAGGFGVGGICAVAEAEFTQRILPASSQRLLQNIDDTRVCLSLNPGIEGSDYINANYIDVAQLGHVQGWACEAPMETTSTAQLGWAFHWLAPYGHMYGFSNPFPTTPIRLDAPYPT
eukprot:Em0011g127a